MPALVTVDSTPLPQLADKPAYEKAEQAWYYGPGAFYGSGSISTINIKIKKSQKPRQIKITK